jgi:hypothetical protein
MLITTPWFVRGQMASEKKRLLMIATHNYVQEWALVAELNPI